MLSERDVIKRQRFLMWRKGRQRSKRPLQLHPDACKCSRIKKEAYKAGGNTGMCLRMSKGTIHPTDKLRQQRSLLLSSDTELVIKVFINASKMRQGQKESAGY